MKRFLPLLFAAAALSCLPAAADAATGIIEGHVTPVEWAPEIEVCVVEGRPSEICAEPAADGSYTLYEVPLGGARIEFVPSVRSGLLKQYYDEVTELSKATNVVLTPGESRRGEVNGHLFAAGSITGVVTGAPGGEALPEVEVCAISVGTPPSKGCAETDAAGEYAIHGLPPEKYSVRFTGAGASARYEPSTHAPVSVSVGTTTSVSTSLFEGGRIEGSVSAAAGGERLADTSVCLFAAARPKAERCTHSDDAGDYAFEGLPTGSYQVGFSLDAAELGGQGSFGEDGFESQYYDGVGTRAAAATISLLAPATVVAGIDAALTTPPAPPPPAAAPLVGAPAVSTPSVAVPVTKTTPTCKKPKKKRKVKGKVRCVKPTKQKGKKRTGKKHHGPKKKHPKAKKKGRRPKSGK